MLDSFALLALFYKEKGADEVGELINAAHEGKVFLFLNSLNLAEVLYRIGRKGGSIDQVFQDINRLPITIIDPSKQQALIVGHLKARYSVSLADCYLASSAQLIDAIVVTGDPDFKKLERVVKVRWIR